jgi:homoserine dehydrogenase
MKRIAVTLFGCGGVGRALLRQIIAGRVTMARRNQVQFDVVGIVDSQSWLWELNGLDINQIERVLVAKERGHRVGAERPTVQEIMNLLKGTQYDDSVIVDMTAADSMEPVIDQALENGYGVVLANKKPLAGPWSISKVYFNNPRLRYEATVGGGQPVIATLRYLLDTDDPIYRIEGQLSGTLGYICGRMDDGISFSEAIAEAKIEGYTEPDPREDLGGRDVMRKVLILARTAGWQLEETEIEVEALYPPSLGQLTVTEFMGSVMAMDAPIQERVKRAQTAGELIRYLAVVDERGGSVGLKVVPKAEPLANIKYISFQTGRYDDEPLMIGGKGAGVEMTAAGVLGDMLSLARETN